MTSLHKWTPSTFIDDPSTEFQRQISNLEEDDDDIHSTQAVLSTQTQQCAKLPVQDINFNVTSEGIQVCVCSTNSVEVPPGYNSPIFAPFAYATVKQDVQTNGIMHERAHHAIPANVNYQQLSPYFAYRPIDVIRHTLNNTTQLAKVIIRFPLQKHIKSRHQMLRRPRLNEVIATDTYFSSVRSIEGYNCAQVYYGCTSKIIEVYGMRTESEFISTYQDFMRERGIPHTLRRDNAKSENSAALKQLHRDLIVNDQFTEPHHPQQNPAEGGAVKFIKQHVEVLMNMSGASTNLWYLCAEYICHIHNICANPSNNWQIPNQVSGGLPKIYRTDYFFIGINRYYILILHPNFQTVKKSLDTLLDLH